MENISIAVAYIHIKSFKNLAIDLCQDQITREL